MLGVTSSSRKSAREGAEKPFWISFSDLMTALMALFLVVMAAALLSVTHGVRYVQDQQRVRATAIRSCMTEVLDYTQTIPGVRLNDQSVYFGQLARFDNNSSALSAAQGEFLRRFIPRVLVIARTPACSTFLKQITVEGFASQRGTYLHNLDLSTRRSERVLCALLEPSAARRLSEADQRLIQELFSVGGYSFNSTQKNDEDSRRIEMKLEFYAVDEKPDFLATKRKRLSTMAVPENAECPLGDR